jgi:hypothetical protein
VTPGNLASLDRYYAEREQARVAACRPRPIRPDGKGVLAELFGPLLAGRTNSAAHEDAYAVQASTATNKPSSNGQLPEQVSGLISSDHLHGRNGRTGGTF